MSFFSCCSSQEKNTRKLKKNINDYHDICFKTGNFLTLQCKSSLLYILFCSPCFLSLFFCVYVGSELLFSHHCIEFFSLKLFNIMSHVTCLELNVVLYETLVQFLQVVIIVIYVYKVIV